MAGRILVAVKRVMDYNARVRVKPDKVGRWRRQRRRRRHNFRLRCSIHVLLPDCC